MRFKPLFSVFNLQGIIIFLHYHTFHFLQKGIILRVLQSITVKKCKKIINAKNRALDFIKLLVPTL